MMRTLYGKKDWQDMKIQNYGQQYKQKAASSSLKTSIFPTSANSNQERITAYC